ncbi:prefoldin subunit 2 [Fistulifera solaris]|uniref:Prefoldin subunit 2 n=1 Tax=Fistulifera solaris TaxID=1519565 RepID=A0A1Z5KNS3_FISSO|nr:prefoldin subunit 2 [Fistulifera solaris]|eukprot:GAX27974.1 prefoldin subunit 2 [Fistulifera solaris]
MTTPPPPEVVQKFRQLLQQSQSLLQKIAELEMDRNEHKLVEDSLQPLDPQRKAYRLVGEMLVERTVQEVLPSIRTNRTHLDATIETLRERLETMQKEAEQIRQQYNLQVQ